MKENKKMFANESFNESMFDHFSVEELEQRLETDPLAVGQLLDLSTTTELTSEAEGCCLFASNTGEVN